MQHLKTAVSYCTFTNNISGGIDFDTSYGGVTNCQFVNNQGASPITVNSAYVVIERCAFTGNIAYRGSGVIVSGGSLTLNNSLVSGNQATTQGGAVDVSSANVTLAYDTIADNTGPNGGVGLNVSGGSLSVRNSILWNNTSTTPYLAKERVQVAINGVTPVITSTIIQGLSQWQDAAQDNQPYDPLFVDEPNANYQLSPASPGIHSGLYQSGDLTVLDLIGNLRTSTAETLGAYTFTNTPGATARLVTDFSDRSVCSGAGTSFSVSNNAAGSVLTVVWQVNTGGGFVPVTTNFNNVVVPLFSSTGNPCGSTLVVSALDS